MPYITRDDGEHFVIPSYRDVLAAKNKTQLKKDILLLSQSYGEYITLQRKGASQYEIAFSPDTGYLLGESIWHHFKRPIDMIYCEAIPDTTEAILVIVKAGSVYLDGRFPLENIAEELIIFLTQQNNFEIYTYGEVPLAEKPTEGKLSFDPNSVKSFTILEQPAFPTLPLLKIYQLQLVDVVLKAHGIGVFPAKNVVIGIIIIGLIWMFYSYLVTPKVEVEQVPEVNPYQAYFFALRSPAPDVEINKLVDVLGLLFTIPGWSIVHIDYTKGDIVARVQSGGSKMQTLSDWAQKNQAKVDIKTDGIFVSLHMTFSNRLQPTKIYSIKEVLANFIDKLSNVYPGNHIKIDPIEPRGPFSAQKLTVTIEDIMPNVLNLVGQQFKNLPFVLDSLALDIDNGSLSGQLITHVFGN
jgi:hypothetical protein